MKKIFYNMFKHIDIIAPNNYYINEVERFYGRICFSYNFGCPLEQKITEEKIRIPLCFCIRAYLVYAEVTDLFLFVNIL